MDIARALGLAITITNIVMISYLYRRVTIFRPVGWIWLVWMIHSAVYYIALICDIYLGDIISNTQINIWSSGLRLHGYGSILTTMVYIIMVYYRKRK